MPRSVPPMTDGPDGEGAGGLPDDAAPAPATVAERATAEAAGDGAAESERRAGAHVSDVEGDARADPAVRRSRASGAIRALAAARAERRRRADRDRAGLLPGGAPRPRRRARQEPDAWYGQPHAPQRAATATAEHDAPRAPAATAREPWLTPARLASLIAVLVVAYGALTIVRALRSLLVMLLVSLFLSFAMEPAVQWLHRRGWRRGPATAVVFLGVFVGSVAVIAAIVPLVIAQVRDLIRNVPRSVEDINALLAVLPFDVQLEPSSDLRAEVARLSRDFGDEIRNALLGAAGNVVDIGRTVLGAVLQSLTILLVTFYLVADGPRLRRTLAAPFPPDRQREIVAVWEVAVDKTGGYIYSRLLLAAVSSVATTLFLLLLGVPYPLPLGLWVGVTGAFVPIVGTYLGGLLAVLVAALGDPIDALWVVVFIIVYQQLDNYLLAPRLQSQTMDVHPAVAFVSVLVGGTLLGAVGALLALPATAIGQALLSTYLHRHELIAELDERAEAVDRAADTGGDRA